MTNTRAPSYLYSRLLGYGGVSQNWGYLFGGPHTKDCSVLGSIMGFPYFGNYHVTIGYIEPRTRYSGNWSLRTN